MKRIVLASTAAVAAAAIGLPSATAHPAAARTIKLVEHDAGLSAVDLPPVAASENAPPSRGDLVIFTKRLTTSGGHKAGTMHAVCTVTRPRQSIETAGFQCDATYALRDGRITAATVGSLSAGKLTLAITGGTGAYERAQGEIVSADGKDAVRLAQ
jgi:hypothetical protein